MINEAGKKRVSDYAKIWQMKKEVVLNFQRMELAMRKEEWWLRYRKKHFLQDDGMDLHFRMDEKFYEMVCRFWEKELVPFVVEVVRLMEQSDFSWEQYQHLVDMLMVDVWMEAADSAKQKERYVKRMALLDILCERNDISMMERMKGFDEKRYQKLEEILNAMKETGNPFYIDGNTQINQKRYQDAGWRKYFEKMVLPFAEAIISQGAWHPLFQFKDWKDIAEYLGISSELNPKVTHFFIEDMMGYVRNCEVHRYHPSWMFGSIHYEEIMQKIGTLELEKWDSLSVRKENRLLEYEGNRLVADLLEERGSEFLLYAKASQAEPDNYYFKLVECEKQAWREKFCRISMLEPSYIDDGGSYLTERNLEKLLSFFETELSQQRRSTHSIPAAVRNGWQMLLWETNLERQCCAKDSQMEMKQLPLDLPMPDYRKLATVEMEKVNCF